MTANVVETVKNTLSADVSHEGCLRAVSMNCQTACRDLQPWLLPLSSLHLSPDLFLPRRTQTTGEVRTRRCKVCAGLEVLKPNRTGCFLSSSFSNATLPLIQCPTLRQSQCLFPQTFGPLASSLRLVHCLTAVHPREALAMLMKAVPERAQLSVHTLHPQVGAETVSLASILRALHRDQYTTMRLKDFSHRS